MNDKDIDHLYFWSKHIVNQKYTFKGYKNNILEYDNVGTWNIQNRTSKDTLYTLESTGYPFGKQMWKDVAENDTMLLSFDSCQGRCMTIMLTFLFHS